MTQSGARLRRNNAGNFVGTFDITLTDVLVQLAIS